MSRRKTDKHSESRRAREHAELLKAALARPGIREVMQVYGGWWEREQVVNVYRSAIKKVGKIITTNSSNL